MSTKTQTTTTHYHIQKKRRKEFLEEWRNYRQSVIRKEDVKLVPTARGMREGGGGDGNGERSGDERERAELTHGERAAGN